MLLPILINNYLFLQASENQSVHCYQSNTWSRLQKHKPNRNLLEKHTLYTASTYTIHCRLGRILPRSHEKLSDNSKVFSSVCICRNFVDVVHCYVKGRICPEDLNVMPLDIIHRYVRQLENQQPFVVVLQFTINELK